MTPVEVGVADPDYKHLGKLLETARPYLTEGGFILISFSLQMGDVPKLEELTSKHAWDYSVFVERPKD